MLNLLWEFRYIVVAIVAVIIFGIFEYEELKVRAYALMLQAKSLAKEAVLSSGKEQEDWVVEKLHAVLPKPLGLFISQEVLRKIVAFLYHKAKDYLDDGEINNSI